MDSNQSEEMQAVTLKELTKDSTTPQQSSGENVNVFCEDCQEYFVDGCVVHGKPVFVTDTPVEIDTPLRAFYTIPLGLAVGPSGNRDGGLGVWCTAKVIPKGVMFGPFEGQIAFEQDSTEKLYCQMVQERNLVKPGAFDDSKCNWMRFVNLAKTPEETNLILSQCSGKIYYKVCRSIEPAHELFIWHGEEAVNRPLDKSGEVTGKHGSVCTYNRIEVAGAHSVQQKQEIKTEEEPHHDSINGVYPEREVCNPKNTWLENQRGGNKGETLPGNVSAHLECTSPQDEPDTFEHLLKFGNYKAQSRVDSKNRRMVNPSSLICNKEKHFNCDNCERKFYCEEHLTMHRCTHAGKRPFACEECGRAFAEKWNLKEHCRTHTGVRPYSCCFCSKAFYRSSHLKVHLRRHTGEKPYTCENCHQTFVDSSSLHKHKRLPSGCCKPEYTALIHLVGMKPLGKKESGNCNQASTGDRQLNASREKVLVNGALPENGVYDLPKPQLENEGGTAPWDALINGLERLDSDLFQDKPDTFEHLLKFENYKAQGRLDGKNKKMMNASLLMYNKEKHFNCDNCERKFDRKEHLTMHRCAHTGKRPFACEECGRAFAEKWNLKEHRRTHTGVRPYSCRFCGKAFYRNSHLKVHLRRHTGEKPYTCENCHQTFVDSSSLHKHKRLPSACCKTDQIDSPAMHPIAPMTEQGQNCNTNISGDLPFIQENNMENIRQHRALIHSVEIKPMEKQESGNCDRASPGDRQLNPSGKQVLVNGILPENGVSDLPKPRLENEGGTAPGNALINGLECLDSNPFQDKPHTFEHLLKFGNYKAQDRFDSKNKRTMSPSSLYNKEKRFNCDNCERKFCRKEHLTMHRCTHMGKRPFACEECGRAFAEKWNLKEHRRTHTGVRPYSCHFCGKAFYRNSHLKVHLRRHTGEKPYTCENCHQAFVDSSSLHKHKRLPSACSKTDQIDSTAMHLIAPMTEQGQNCNTNTSGDLPLIQGNNMENIRQHRGCVRAEYVKSLQKEAVGILSQGKQQC